MPTGRSTAVAEFLDAIGYATIDAGPLAENRRFQPGAPAYGVGYAEGNVDFAASPGVPASVEVVRRALPAGWPLAYPTGRDHWGVKVFPAPPSS